MTPEPSPAQPGAAGTTGAADPFKLIDSHERAMYAARIELARGDDAAAAHILDNQLDGYDGPDWNGTETGLEWLERARTAREDAPPHPPLTADAYEKHIDQVLAPVRAEVDRLRAEQKRQADQHARAMAAEDGDYDRCEPTL